VAKISQPPYDGCALALPSHIGRYEILGLLGTGGMAEVFLGRLVGPSGFLRPVVIKRTLPHLAREKTFVEMFLDEARIVARIRHPNVVQVQELCQDGDDLFLVMEYLEGESLAGLMRRLSMHKRLLSFDLCAYVISEVCTGVNAAHELTDEAGTPLHLVHRDVSPANIFVTYDGQVKILDFGIATAADRLSRTQAGQVKGKYPYMSPEQCRTEDLDRRSDIFSVGIVLFELSTCRRLFKRASEIQTVEAICKRDATRPSALVEGYPSDLEAVCMRALSRDREDRYPTAQEMRRELVRVSRELNPKGDHVETLRAVMQRLFPDRIEEKRQMLAKIQQGREVTRVPIAEADESHDLPRAVEQSHSEVKAELPAQGEKRVARRAWIAGASAAGLAVIGLTAALTTGGSGSAGARPGIDDRPTVARATADSATVAKALPAPEKPRTIQLSIVSEPPGAKVFFGDAYRGTTPFEIAVDKSDRAITVRLERAGYKSVVEEVLPDRDQRLRSNLIAASKSKTSKSKAEPARDAKRDDKQPEPDPYRKFD
jgi:serine/threonine-protein kinase